MRRFQVERILRLSDSRYAVDVSIDQSPGQRSFVFTASGDDVRVIASPVEFEELMAGRVGAAKALLAAVLAFDRAQGIIVP